MALRDQEAAGSNPVTPMRKPAKSLRFGGFSFFAFSGLTTGFTIDRAEVGETVFLVCSALVSNARCGTDKLLVPQKAEFILFFSALAGSSVL